MKFSLVFYGPEKAQHAASWLQLCLKSLERQTHPDGIEVLLADASPEQNIMVPPHPTASRYTLVTIDARGQSLPAAINVAISQASGDVVIGLPLAARLEPDFLSRLQKLFEQSQAQAIGGRLIGRAETAQGEAIASALASPFGYGDAKFWNLAESQSNGNHPLMFGAYQIGLFRELGKFVEDIGYLYEEEFWTRLQKAGKKRLFTPELTMPLQTPENFVDLGCMGLETGALRARAIRRYPLTRQRRHFVPALFLTFVLLSFPFSLLIPYLWVLGILTFLARLVLNQYYSLGIARQHGWHLLRHLALSFDSIHFAYGLGFCYGLVQEWSQSLKKA
jgi:hypothetical protein